MSLINPQEETSTSNVANVDASVLNNIKGSYEPVLNKDNFQLSDITPEQQAEFDKMSYIERNPATAPLSLTDYYPDVNNNINVGSYSGSMIGSTTLFAPGGGLVPLGMMDARDKAIQDAAYSKAKEYDAFRKMYQAPTTKLVNIQPEISSEYNKMLQGYIQEAKKKYGSQWAKKLETDQNFLAKNKAFQDLAKYGDSIVESKAKLDEAKKTGKYTVTPALLETERKLMSATDPNSPEFKKLGDYYRSFNMDLDFNDVFNETVKQIAMQQDAAAGANTSDPEYIRTFDSTKKYYNKDSIDAAVESMKAQFPGSTYFNNDYIEKNVRARMSAVQEDKKAGATQKREANSGVDFKYDLNNDFSDEPTSITATVQQKKEAGGGTYQSDVTGTDGVTFKKPIPVVMPIGKDTYFTDEGLVPSQNLGNKSVLLGDMVIVDVIDNKGQWNDGVPLTKEQLKSGEYKKTRKESMVLGKYKEKDADGVEAERSFFVPTKKVENSLVKKWGKDKSVEMGVPVDESYRRVANYNSKNKPKSYQQGLNDNVKSKDNTGTQSAKKETMKTKSGITFTVE